MSTSSCFELNVCFPAVSFDVTGLWLELCAFHQKEPIDLSTCLCMNIELHILMYYYWHEVVAIACTLNAYLCLVNCEWRCITDNMETCTKWTAPTLLPEYRLHDDSQRLSWCYCINESTLPYFGNILYLLSLAFSVLPHLLVTAASKTNYTIQHYKKTYIHTRHKPGHNNVLALAYQIIVL